MGLWASEVAPEVTLPNHGSRVLRVPGSDRRSTGMQLHNVDQSAPGTRETFKPIVKGLGDEELVGWVAEGDERALSELYDRYSRHGGKASGRRPPGRGAGPRRLHQRLARGGIVRPKTGELRNLALQDHPQPGRGSGS